MVLRASQRAAASIRLSSVRRRIEAKSSHLRAGGRRRGLPGLQSGHVAAKGLHHGNEVLHRIPKVAPPTPATPSTTTKSRVLTGTGRSGHSQRYKLQVNLWRSHLDSRSGPPPRASCRDRVPPLSRGKVQPGNPERETVARLGATTREVSPRRRSEPLQLGSSIHYPTELTSGPADLEPDVSPRRPAAPGLAPLLPKAGKGRPAPLGPA